MAPRPFILFTVLALGLCAPRVQAELVAYFGNGTDADAAALINLTDEGLATVSALDNSQFEGAANTTRPSFGAGNDTPAGPTAGSGVGSEWLFGRADDTPASAISTDGYFAFSITSKFENLDLGTLTFDHVLATGTNLDGMSGGYEVFGRVGAGAFVSLGSGSATPAPSTASTLTMGTASTQVVNVSSLGKLAIGDTAEFRVALTDDANSPGGAQFVQGIQLEGSVADRYSIDIDTSRLGNTNTTGPFETADGWVSLDATNPVDANGASVTVDGIEFSVSSTEGSRVRTDAGAADPNALTGDFVFDAGPNAAIVFDMGGAGDLAAGYWLVEIWSHDADFVVGDQIVALRVNDATPSGFLSETVGTDPEDPAFSFVFASDGVSAYDFFIRENNDNNDRVRLNAVRLTRLVPAPAALPAGLVMLGIFASRRRRV